MKEFFLVSQIRQKILKILLSPRRPFSPYKPHLPGEFLVRNGSQWFVLPYIFYKTPWFAMVRNGSQWFVVRTVGTPWKLPNFQWNQKKVTKFWKILLSPREHFPIGKSAFQWKMLSRRAFSRQKFGQKDDFAEILRNFAEFCGPQNSPPCLPVT